MTKIFIVADDFTGAMDTGVQFAPYGVNIRVIIGDMVDFDDISPETEVLVLDTETRHLSPERAYEIVGSAVRGAKEHGITYVYKKTDSALRGNVGAELTALLRESGEQQLMFLPALPQMGRVTVSGVQKIDGIPVAESVFGEDPFEPVRHSRVDDIIREQSSVNVTSARALSPSDPIPEEKGIVVFDAETREELISTGKRLIEGGRLNVMAGCSGFGSILPELLGYEKATGATSPTLDHRLLMVCGSVNPITVEQMDEAEKDGFVRIRLTPEQKLSDCFWETASGERFMNKLKRVVQENDYCIIDTNDEAGSLQMEEYTREHRMDSESVRVKASSAIGRIVGTLIDSVEVGTLLVTGGDTLLACLRYMGVGSVEPICEIDSGVVLFRLFCKGRKQYILSKSGGFGGRKLITDLAKKISKPDLVHV